MKHPVLDSVSDEQKELKKPWALISMLSVFILFGAYWAIEKNNSSAIVIPVQPETAKSAPENITLKDIDYIQQGLASTSVLEYSSIF